MSGHLQKEADFYSNFIEGGRTAKEFCGQVGLEPAVMATLSTLSGSVCLIPGKMRPSSLTKLIGRKRKKNQQQLAVGDSLSFELEQARRYLILPLPLFN